MKTINAVLASLWSVGKGRHDMRVYVRQYGWTDTTTHSDGFTQLQEIDVTSRVEWAKLQTIVMQVESYRQAQFGVIKPDSWTQEFIEKTEGIAISELGALLKDILLENDTDTTFHYKVDSDDCHLWELVVKIGDAENDLWMSPVFSFIFGFVFDPDVDPDPTWEGIHRGTGQVFELTGHDLFHWMDKVSSKWLGDYKNPAPVWGDRSAGEELSTDDFGPGLTRVGNYPVPPFIKKMLNEMGVTDANINTLEVPVDTGATSDFSTFDWEDTINLEDSNVRQYQLPDAFYWKTTTDDESNNIHYFVYVSYASASAQCKVAAWNQVKGDVTVETLSLHTIVSSPSCPQTAYPRRLWYEGSGNVFYLLMEDTATSPDDWYIWAITLGGTIELVQTNSTGVESALDDPSGSYERHWGQCDLDMANRRLYGAICYYSGNYTWYELGYWAMSNGAWTSIWTYHNQLHGVTFKIPNGVNQDEYITGFRCLRSGGTNHGIVAFVCSQGGAPLSPFVYTLYYDDTQASANVGALYDKTTSTGNVLSTAWSATPLLNGRGSVGGFVDGSKYYFVLTSIKFSGGNRNGYWTEWDYDTAYTNYAHGQLSNTEYRTFNSHGSAALDFCTGYTGGTRDTDGVDIDYWVEYFPAFFHISGGTKTRVIDSTYGAFSTGSADEWAILGAMSCTPYSGSADNVKYRPFNYWKSFDDSEGTSRDRQFFVIFGEHWIPQLSRDFPTDGGSMAQELQDMAWAYGLLMYLSLWYCVVMERYDGVAADVDANRGTITPEQYEWNSVRYLYTPKFEKVSINYGGDSNAEYPANSISKIVLDLTTNYLINDRRATLRAKELHTLHGKNRVIYEIDGIMLSEFEPLDIVKLHVPVPPGEQGYYDGSTQKYRNVSGTLTYDTLDEVLGMVMRVEIDGEETRLQIVSLGSTPGAAI